MGELTKYGGTECRQHIVHNLRGLPEGKTYGNESVDPRMSHLNYSLIDRGASAKEVNDYRLNLEKEIFKYNRKNLVHSVEIVLQLPDDADPAQEKEFFQECYNYVVSQLPMGEKCVVVATVHKDEHKYVNGIDISKPHLHLMYVPAVPDTKHEGYDFKLCADALTKRAALKAFHPGLQKHLTEKNIAGTVYKKKNSAGKTIGLSVKDLKAITDRTGIVFKESLTVDALADILVENRDIKISEKSLEKALKIADAKLKDQSEQIHSLKAYKELASKVPALQKELQHAHAALKAQNLNIESSNRLNHSLNEQLKKSKETINNLDYSLKEKELKIAELERTIERARKHQLEKEISLQKDIPQENGWNRSSGWNRDNEKELKRTW